MALTLAASEATAEGEKMALKDAPVEDVELAVEEGNDVAVKAKDGVAERDANELRETVTIDEVVTCAESVSVLTAVFVRTAVPVIGAVTVNVACDEATADCDSVDVEIPVTGAVTVRDDRAVFVAERVVRLVADAEIHALTALEGEPRALRVPLLERVEELLELSDTDADGDAVPEDVELSEELTGALTLLRSVRVDVCVGDGRDVRLALADPEGEGDPDGEPETGALPLLLRLLLNENAAERLELFVPHHDKDGMLDALEEDVWPSEATDDEDGEGDAEAAADADVHNEGALESEGRLDIDVEREAREDSEALGDAVGMGGALSVPDVGALTLPDKVARAVRDADALAQEELVAFAEDVDESVALLLRTLETLLRPLPLEAAVSEGIPESLGDKVLVPEDEGLNVWDVLPDVESDERGEIVAAADPLEAEGDAEGLGVALLTGEEEEEVEGELLELLLRGAVTETRAEAVLLELDTPVLEVEREGDGVESTLGVVDRDMDTVGVVEREGVFELVPRELALAMLMVGRVDTLTGAVRVTEVL